jgi:hypothetical protein
MSVICALAGEVDGRTPPKRGFFVFRGRQARQSPTHPSNVAEKIEALKSKISFRDENRSTG